MCAGVTLFCRDLELWQHRETLSQTYHSVYYYVDGVGRGRGRGRGSLRVPIGAGTAIVTFCYAYNRDGHVRRFVSSPVVRPYYPVRARVVVYDQTEGPRGYSASGQHPWFLFLVVPMSCFVITFLFLRARLQIRVICDRFQGSGNYKKDLGRREVEEGPGRLNTNYLGTYLAWVQIPRFLSILIR